MFTAPKINYTTLAVYARTYPLVFSIKVYKGALLMHLFKKKVGHFKIDSLQYTCSSNFKKDSLHYNCNEVINYSELIF